MRCIALLLLGSLVSCELEVTPSDLANFFASSKELSMTSSDAAELAAQEAPKLTQCAITVSMLQALCDTMYADRYSCSYSCSYRGLELSVTQVRQFLLPVAYQQVEPANLASLFSTLYSTNGVDMQKSDARSRAIELAKLQVDASNLQSLFSALYATSGLDLPKKDAQQQALELAVAGANSTQLKLAYQGFTRMGKSKQDALQAAIPEAVLAGFNGLARRHAQDTTPYTAAEFQMHFGGDWESIWAKSPQEERVANDHHAYGIADFIKYYKDSWYWSEAKTATQKRLADDGKPYTMEEFQQYYTSTWQQKWLGAPVLPCAECSQTAQQQFITV